MNSGDYVSTSYGLSSTTGIFGAIAGMMTFIWIIAMVISIVQIVAMWKIFTKAGKPGWASLVPIYNIYIMCEIAQQPWWYIILLIIPLANIYAMFLIYGGVAKKFGKSKEFAIGMILFPYIFFPILAFGKNSIYLNDESYNNEQTETLNSEENISYDSSSLDNVSEINNQNASEGYVAPTFDNQPLNDMQPMNGAPMMNPAPGMNMQSAPMMNPAQEMGMQSAPTMNPAPGMDMQSAPTMNLAPGMNMQSAPTMNPAPTMDMQSAPTINPAPEMGMQGAPTMNPTPGMGMQGAPTINPAPGMDMQNPEINAQPVQPVVEQNGQEPSDQTHTSLWSNNNLNNQ